MYFEMDSNRWGESAGTGAQRNGMGQWGADRAAVEVKQVYINFTIPTTPVDLRAGIIPHAIRPWFFWYNDGPGIEAMAKYENWAFTLGWGKQWEGNDWSWDDQDIWYADVNFGWEGWKFGGYLAYQDDQRADYDHLYWIGLYADGKAGPIALQLDGAYDWGSNKIGGADQDYKGYAFRGVASYNWNEWKFGLGFAWFSGDDFEEYYDPATGLAINNGDLEAFRQPWLGEQGAINGDLAVLNGGCFGTGVCTTNVGLIGPTGNLAGYWYGRLFAEWACLPWLKLMGQVGYIGDTSDNMDTFGTAIDPATGNPDDNDDIGWEFDVGAEIQIYKNLKYNMLFGYLVAGDALDVLDLDTGLNDSPNDPWVFITALAYTF